jgi:hypothetical protein
MKMTHRKLLIAGAVFLAIGLAAGFHLYLPAGPSVTDSHAIEKGTTLADIEAAFGRPVIIGTVSFRSLTIGIWEVRDGWVTICFDADNRVQSSVASTEGWVARKRQRIKWAFDW